MTKTSTIKALLASLLLTTASAQAAPVVLDFEDFTGVDFQHGTIVNSQYSGNAFGGVNISATNEGGGPDLAVTFNSDESPTEDPDLESPFYTSRFNEANDIDPFNPGNILIIQENAGDCNLIICDPPDDEGSRDAGVISFEFDSVIELLSIDFFDIEALEDGATDPDKNGIRLYSDLAGNNEIAANTYFTPDVSESDPNGLGDNLWEQILFGNGINGIRRIDVHFGGSGALDNLTYNVVPIPAAFWLFGTALIGFIGFSRRTSV